jgi:branched-chain amino acid transport system substrate-binding protein
MALRYVQATCLAALVTLCAPASANDTVTIGVILPYSGPFADGAKQIDNGIRLFMKQHGDTVAGKTIILIRRDVAGTAPDVAKRLASELVVRDKVDILAGFGLTPNALAAADVADRSRKLMVVMNAAGRAVTTKSPYIVRTSVILQQSAATIGGWAARNGLRRMITMVSDFAPGHEVEAAFAREFSKGGGEIVSTIRIPVSTLDFSAHVQRAKDLRPDGIYLFVPGGVPGAAMAKALADRGIGAQNIALLGQSELAHQDVLSMVGAPAIGIITASHYDHNIDSQRNRDFVKDYVDAFGREPDVFSVGGYDGMQLIYEALKRTGGDPRGDRVVAAVKGATWESPRGTLVIDPERREPIQTIYIRRVENVNGTLKNVVIERVDAVGAD